MFILNKNFCFYKNKLSIFFFNTFLFFEVKYHEIQQKLNVFYFTLCSVQLLIQLSKSVFVCFGEPNYIFVQNLEREKRQHVYKLCILRAENWKSLILVSGNGGEQSCRNHPVPWYRFPVSTLFRSLLLSCFFRHIRVRLILLGLSFFIFNFVLTLDLNIVRFFLFTQSYAVLLHLKRKSFFLIYIQK